MAEAAAPLHRGPLLEVDELHRDFGGLRAVDGATFSVGSGTITGLIGPNGAGKSTLIALVAGSLRPSRGTIRYDGTDITACPAHRRARAGLIRTFQLASEFPQLTVLENVLTAAQAPRGDSVWGALRGRRYWRASEQTLIDDARTILDRFDLSKHENDYGSNLSGGQKRLLELARAVMARPKLLLLDEPFAGVNPTLGRRIERALELLRDEGVTLLMVEHELGIVGRLCDPIIVMANGQVIGEGPMHEIRKNEAVLDAYLVG